MFTDERRQWFPRPRGRDRARSARRRRDTALRCAVEGLEDRVVLSITGVSYSGNTLLIASDIYANNTIQVATQPGGQAVDVYDGPTKYGSYSLSPVNYIQVNTGYGNDSVSFDESNGNLPSTIYQTYIYSNGGADMFVGSSRPVYMSSSGYGNSVYDASRSSSSYLYLSAADADMTLTDNQLVVGATTSTLRNVRQVTLYAYDSSRTDGRRIDASGYSGSASLQSNAPGSTLIGGTGSTSFNPPSSGVNTVTGHSTNATLNSTVQGTAAATDSTLTAPGLTINYTGLTQLTLYVSAVSGNPSYTVDASAAHFNTTFYVYAANVNVRGSQGSAAFYAYGSNLSGDTFDGSASSNAFVYSSRDANQTLTDTRLTVGGEVVNLLQMDYAYLTTSGSDAVTLDASAFSKPAYLYYYNTAAGTLRASPFGGYLYSPNVTSAGYLNGTTGTDSYQFNNSNASVNGRTLSIYGIGLLTVDTKGGVDSITLNNPGYSVRILNQAPRVTLPASAFVMPGSTFTAAGSFSDWDGSSWTATVDYGDGAGPQALSLTASKTFSLSRVYLTPGTKTVTVTVTNNLGTSFTGTESVTVNPVSTFSSLSAPTITYGTGSVLLSGRIADGTVYPPGSVSITVAGVTQSAAIDGSGNFSSLFASATFAASGSPYTITYAYAGGSGFTAVSDTSKRLTVNKATLVVTANNASRTYGADNPSFGATLTGVRNNDAIGVSFSTTANPFSPVGNYNVVPTPTGAALSNYSVSTFMGTLQVTPAALTVTANNAADKTYGQSLTLTGTEFSTTGLLNNDSVTSVALATAGADATSPVGAYAITPSAASGYGLGNYTIGYAAGSLNVTPAALTVTANGVSDKTYGTTVAFNGTEFTASGLLNSDSVASVSLASDGAGPTADVGDYDITPSAATGSGLSNYAITYVKGQLTVTQANLEVQAESRSMTYGGQLPPLGGDIYGIRNNDLDTGRLVVTFTTDATPTSPVGTYGIGIEVGGTAAGNYLVRKVTANAKFTVKPAALTVTAGDPAAKTYGTALDFAGTEFTASGLLNGDTVTSVSLSSDGAAATAGVGSYDVTASAAAGSGLDNYNITYAAGHLSVTPAALTVTATDPAEKTYGDDLTLDGSGFTTDGLVNGDSVTSVTLASDGAAASADAGAYDVTPSGAVGTGLDNYTITYVSGQLYVRPAHLSVVPDAVSMTYGGALPELTGTVDGVRNGDLESGRLVVTYSTEADPGSPVGLYTVTVEITGPAASNYKESLKKAWLTVNPAALTVTASDPAAKTYGTALTFDGTEFTADGLVNGDTVTSVTLTSAGAAATAGVGTYDVNASAAAGTGLDNYTITYVGGHVSVTPAALTVAANKASKAYGDAVTFAGTEFTAEGLVNGDAVTSVSLASDGAAAEADAGTYDLTVSAASGAGLDNYTITYVNNHLSVRPAGLTVLVDNQTMTYGGAVPVLTGTVDGVRNGDVDAGRLVITYATTATSASGVGRYAIGVSISGSAAGNYALVRTKASVLVTPAPLTVTAASAEKTYGSTRSFDGTEFTADGLVNGDTVTSVTLASDGAAPGATVGTYAITADAADGTGLQNYDITYVNGALRVTPASLTVTANKAFKVYGDTLTFAGTEFTADGLVNGDTVTTVTLSSDGAAATADVDVYDLAASAASGSGLENYEITYVSNLLDVQPVGLTILVQNQTMTYGGAVPVLTGTVVGVLNGDDTSGRLVVTYSTLATSASGVGSYWISVDLSGPAAGNYFFKRNRASVVVTPAPLTVTAASADKTYGTTRSFDGTEFTADGLVNGDTVTSVTLASDGAAPGATVGTYAITADAADGTGLQNYDITYVNGALRVTPAALTVSAADPADKTYGDTLTFDGTGFTADGLVNGDTVASVSLASEGAPASASVGDYAVTPSAAAGSGLENYAITYVAGRLAVTPASLVVTPDDQSMTYGGALPSLTGTLLGVRNGDDASGGLVVTYSTSATSASSVGQYLILPSVGGDASGNYQVVAGRGTLSVTPASLTVTAAPATKTYGGTLTFAGTEFSAAGLVNGDTVDAVTLASDGAAAGAAVGSYDISASDAVGSGLSNYTITYAAGTLDVTPAALTVTAGDAPDKTYGDTLTLSGTAFTAVGLVNGDAVTSVTLSSPGAAATALVGSFEVNAADALGSGLSNYVITYVPGHLKVTPAELTVTAAGASKTYGDALAFAGTGFGVSGLVNGDLVTSVTLSSPGAAATADVGTYAIAASGATGTGLSNYVITYVNGSLTVTPAALTVTADPKSMTYGGAFPTLTATVAGVKNGDADAGRLVVSLATAATGASHVGTYAVTPSVAGSAAGNYAVTITGGTLAVTPASLLIVADDQTMAYGGALPSLTAHYYGLVNGDTVLTFTQAPNAAPTLSTAPANSAPGTYAITVSGARNPDYDIRYQNGTLTVGRAATAFSGLTALPVVIAAGGTMTVGYGGLIGAGSRVPTWESVVVSLNGVDQGTATVLPGGLFVLSATTATLPAGRYTVTFRYAGDTYLQPATSTTTLTIGYTAAAQYDQTQAKKAGSTYPIKVSLADAAGANAGSAGLAVQALYAVGPNGLVAVDDAGSSNPNNLFRYDTTTRTYQFNLKTTGYAPGKYTLYFSVGTGLPLYSVGFVVK